MPEASSSPDWKAGLLSSIKQCEKEKSPQASPPALTTLLTAKTVLVVEPLALDPTNAAGQTLKKALVKWGHFHIVDDAESADLIMVVSEFSSSKPTKMERIREALAVFAGSTLCGDATPLWVVNEVGPALGQRPTGKLVEDLRKQLAKLENSVHASAAPSPT